MTAPLATALPAVLADARSLAAAAPVDTSPLEVGPVLIPLSDHDRVLVRGKDRVRFLHAMLSNDVASLAAGGGRWATFNSVQGRTVTDVRLFDLDDDRKAGSILALLEPGARDAFVQGLDRFVISEKVFFEDDEGGVLWLLAGVGVDDRLRALGVEPPGEDLFDHREVEIGGATARLLRLDRSGPGPRDVAIWARRADEGPILAALEGIPRGDRSLLEAARVRAGQLRFGLDLTSANIPLEAGLRDRAISFTKGCYIGQEVICRIDSLGRPARALVRLTVEGDVPMPGAELRREGKAVGWVTSVAPSDGGAVAFGYVKKRNHDPGTVLDLDGGRAVVGEAL